MNPSQAADQGVDPDAVRVISEVGRYGGDWRCEVDLEDRTRVLFADPSIFTAARWLAALRRRAAGIPII